MAAQGADDDAWLVPIKNDLRKDFVDLEPPPIHNIIFRVPDNLRIGKDDAYSPLSISIGPLHHGKENLKTMEKHKLVYIVSLFDRTRDKTEVLDLCTRAVSNLDEFFRGCYEEKVEHTKSELIRMMLLDGCFILELFFRYCRNEHTPDIIFGHPWMISNVRHDLALLENQIPFIVLDKLFEVIISHSFYTNPPNLVDLARCFFKLDRVTDECRVYCHLLDLIYYCCSPSSPLSEQPHKNLTWKVIPPATKLSEAGVEFVGIEHENDRKRSLFDLVEFKDGVIKIPQLCVDSSLFQNLIAMEQLFSNHTQYMTSYGLLMDYFIDSSKDVEFLVNKKIIPHSFGDYGAVADLFNNIGKQALLRDFYFAELCEQVHECYQSKWHVYKNSLLHDYFGNPWKVISVTVHIFIFILLL